MGGKVFDVCFPMLKIRLAGMAKNHFVTNFVIIFFCNTIYAYVCPMPGEILSTLAEILSTLASWLSAVRECRSCA